MFNLFISALALFTADATDTTDPAPMCEPMTDYGVHDVEPTDLLADESEPIAEAVCGSPLCVYQTPAGTFTNRCDTSCVWEAGVAQTCGGYTCTPIAPASSCRWHCV